MSMILVFTRKSRAPPPQQIQLRGVRALWPVAGTWLSRDRDE